MNYWEQRTKQLNKSLEKDEERLKRRLVNYYKREAKRLDKEIASFYQKYGENNIIEYRKLLQQMSSDDIQLLYEDMDEFARKYPQYSHLMPTRANIYKLTRLEGLQQSVYMAQLRLGAITDIELTAHLQKQAKRYGKAADTANGKVFSMVNEQTVKGFVNTEWSNGKNFSQRIWDNAQKLADTLNTELAQGFARGEAYEKLTKQITDKFETVSRNNAYRLIYTEGTYVMNESSIQGFSEDFKQYEYSIVEDGHACPICTALNGKVFNIKDRVPGVNFPPMHPWCRCTFKVHVDDWNEWLQAQSNKTRAEKVLNNLSENDIISGGITGALDPNSKKANAHAKLYYEEIRNRTTDVATISKNTGIDEKSIKTVKNYVFYDTHDLGDRGIRRFDESYDMAQSWHRLIDGKQEKHDITLIYHELYEKELVDKGMSQDMAHIKASKKYNYRQEVGEYNDKIVKHKKNR